MGSYGGTRLIRYTVRRFDGTQLESHYQEVIQSLIESINDLGWVQFRYVYEPGGLDPKMIAYGDFSGVTNYIMLMAKPDEGSDFRVGYYGEYLATNIEQLGLKTGWISIERTMREPWLTAILAVGISNEVSEPHLSRPKESLVEGSDHPDWFWEGVQEAMRAPTYLNQQRFILREQDGIVDIEPKWVQAAKIDAGIVAFHFEKGCPQEVKWASTVPYCPKIVK